MANVKITELTAATALAGTDVLPIVDVGADATKKVSVSDLLRNLPDGSAASPSLAFADDQNTGVLSPGNNSLAFATSGTQRLVIDSSGQVGIGTSSPAEELHVAGKVLVEDSFPSIFVKSSGTTLGGVRADGTNKLELKTVTTAPLSFQINSSEKARIDSSGRLLIGTTSSTSQAKLVIEGQISNSAAGAILNIQRGEAVSSITSGEGIGNINFTDNGSKPFASINVQADGTAGTNDYPGRILFQTTADGGSSPTERMRIDSSGNVNIGSSTYSGINERLCVTGQGIVTQSAATTNRALFGTFGGSDLIVGTFDSNDVLFRTGNTERMRIDSSGRLLVGTTSGRNVGGGANALVQVETTSQNGISFVCHRGTSTSGSILVLGKSRGTAAGSSTIVANGDELGAIRFAGADGTDVESRAASIAAFVDGAPGSNDMPGRLVFSTTADGASSPTERMRIASSGKVGIGTSSPSQLLDLASTAPNIRLTDTVDGHSEIDGNAASLKFNADKGNAKAGSNISFAVDNSERMRIDSSGRLGIGITAPTEKLFINDSSNNVAIELRTGGASFNAVTRFNADSTNYASAGLENTALVFRCSNSSTPTERMRIDSSGRLLVGGSATVNSSGGAYIQLTGGDSENIKTYRIGTGAREHLQFYNGDFNSRSKVGSISTSGSSTAFNTSSDYRLKENVVDLDGGITRVKQLQPRRFNFIADNSRTVDGFIAHEAQTVVPEAVDGTHNEVDADGNPVYQGIDQSKLVPLLTAALQEAIAKIETLETKVAALEAQ